MTASRSLRRRKSGVSDSVNSIGREQKISLSVKNRNGSKNARTDAKFCRAAHANKAM